MGAARLLVALLALSSLALSDVVTIDFETLPDAYFFSAGGQNIGSYYSGVTFGPYVTGLSVTRFGGYDDSGFPPHSGDVAVWSAYDDPMTLMFDTPETVVGFWYTSLNPITLTVYDGSDNALGSVIGLANTDGTTGTSSYIEFDGTGIASAAISSEAGQYVIDDVSFGTGAVEVPEPSSMTLLTWFLAIVFLTICVRRACSRQSFSSGSTGVTCADEFSEYFREV